MKFSKAGTAFRKWSRIIHRDFSFFFSGMVLIYAISGIVMNHRNTINPNYSVERQEYTITEVMPPQAGMEKDDVLKLLAPLGEEKNYTKHYFPKENQMKVFLKGGGQSADPASRLREADTSSVDKRPDQAALQSRKMVDSLRRCVCRRTHHYYRHGNGDAERTKRLVGTRRYRTCSRYTDSVTFSISINDSSFAYSPRYKHWLAV